MSGTDAATYSLRGAQQSLGLSRSVLCGLIGAGFVSPQRGERNALRFSFRDLMLLRTAYALQQASIPPRKILKSLAQLRANLSDDAPITALRISAVGSDVAVTDALGRWSVESGQALMDFDAAPVGQSGSAAGTASVEVSPSSATPIWATTATPAPTAAASAQAAEAATATATAAGAAIAAIGTIGAIAAIGAVELPDARGWFLRGVATEATDAAQAEQAYRRAIRLDPAFVDAYINLGAMLCEQRRGAEAVLLYDAAAVHCAASAGLWFNRAIALEDAGRVAEAIAAYEEALRIDPTTADAHFNLGRLQERAGDQRGALRHFSAYRRLQR